MSALQEGVPRKGSLVASPLGKLAQSQPSCCRHAQSPVCSSAAFDEHTPICILVAITLVIPQSHMTFRPLATSYDLQIVGGLR